MIMNVKKDSIRVAHVKLHYFSPPSETFVLNRVKNPACKRPTIVLTDEKCRVNKESNEIKIYEINKLPILLKHAEWQVQKKLHLSLFMYYTLKKFKPDIIHAHFSFSAEPCLWAAKRLNIPFIVSFYGVETKYEIYNIRALQKLKRIYANADKITCISECMKNDLLKTGCPKKKIELIRLGVDTKLFSGNIKKWDTKKPLQLLSIARLHPEKGLEYLIKACSILKESGNVNWTLKIIGSGFIAQQLRNQVVSLSLENQIHFLGIKKPVEVVGYLQKAHLMILPSLKETQGVVIQEAQATATPVIASEVGGIPEGIIDGETGYLVPAENPEKIVEKIQLFFANPKLLQSMGKAGKTFVNKKFTQKMEYQQLSKIYREMLL